MRMIVGLGNPGNKYERTRHNTGFMVMDALAKKCNVDITQDKFQSLIVKTKIDGEDVLLVKPQTYMNNSGIAVRACMNFYKIDVKDLLIIYDDLDLPVGQIRLRQKGSAGGHNGIKSIIQHVGSNQFDRIRVGIGRDARIPIIDWVLMNYRPDEMQALQPAIDKAADAAYDSIFHSFDQTMNVFNQK